MKKKDKKKKKKKMNRTQAAAALENVNRGWVATRRRKERTEGRCIRIFVSHTQAYIHARFFFFLVLLNMYCMQQNYMSF